MNFHLNGQGSWDPRSWVKILKLLFTCYLSLISKDNEDHVIYLKVLVTQFVNHSLTPPGSSAHGVLQARVLEWVAISFSRGSS